MVPFRGRKTSVFFILIGLFLVLQGCGGGGSSSGGDPNSSDVTPPSVPTGLSATVISSSEIDLSWNASTDNVEIAGYKIYRNGSYLKSDNLASASDTGLAPSTEYCYSVSAYDAADNESAKSSQVCARTLGSGGGGEDIYSGGVLILAETVKGWVDGGKVNGPFGQDRVVILDVSSLATYNAGHIPGAVQVNSSDLYQNRSDGVIYNINEVPDGPAMDVLVDLWGLDEYTTIIFTSATSTAADADAYLQVARAYFTFRYWGFAKEKLKILNGLNAAYSAKYSLSNQAPVIVPAPNFGIRLFTNFGGCFRASLQEMIDLADGKTANALAIDARGSNGPGGTTYSYDGDYRATSGVFNPSGDYVAFEGHIKGAAALNWTALFETIDSNGDGKTDYRRYLPEADLKPVFTGIGLTPGKTAYVYCRSGVIASAAFAALEAINPDLTLKHKVYDGSWSEWGQLAGLENGGYLPNESLWRTDTPTRTDNMALNKDAGAAIEDPSAGGSVHYDAAGGNQVELTDVNYFDTKPT
jgi:3-mercaptopyruvate sulfurtransferase SseA